MLRTAFLIFITWAIIFSPGCSKNSTPPPPPKGKVDTTSHNFIWKIDTLGPLTTTLSDVTFISDTEAWAVGRIQFVDSTGTNHPYGLAKWDGEKWDFLEIETRPNVAVVGFNGLWAFNESNIWLATGSILHWSGGPYAPISFQRNNNSLESVASIWGDRPDHILAAGAEGLLLSYDGNEWTRYPAVDSVAFRDIFGKAGSSDVWASGFALNQLKSSLLHFDGQDWDAVWETGQPRASPYTGLLQSVWYANNDSIIVAGSAGLYWQDVRGDSPPRQIPLNLGNFPHKVRGNAANDIFVVGDEGMVWHYNGKSWKQFSELQNTSHFFYSIAVRQDKAIIVGLDTSQGIQRLIIVSGERF